MKLAHGISLALLLSLTLFGNGHAQQTLQNDYSFSMKIPSVEAMGSSPAHLYVLSEREGMAVFRTHRDSLQWLYTSAGMQQRGSTIRTDIRFAYLFGDSRRLTVLEPTSVLGAYSSTNLPAPPLDTQRFSQQLYVALGDKGLGNVNLKTPDTVDSPVKFIAKQKLTGHPIISLETSPDQLFALSSDQQLFTFQKNDNSISFTKSVNLSKDIRSIYFVSDRLFGSDESGAIYGISTNGKLSKLGSIGEPVQKIIAWKDWLIIKGKSTRLWTSFQLQEPVLWKKNSDAGNFIATSKGQLWICEYNRISRLREVDKAVAKNSNGTFSGPLTINPVGNQVIPYPHPLLLPLKIKNNFPPDQIQFSYKSDIEDAVIRGESFYWQPGSGDVGEHRFKIIATGNNGQTSTTTFTVDVRSFNAPPRFTPLRTLSIPTGHAFNLPIKAIDPDGSNKNIIRYLGVDLPDGASINEQTGAFNWTPTDRQVGKKTFRVIATDQYGAAASEQVTLRVIETNSGEG